MYGLVRHTHRALGLAELLYRAQLPILAKNNTNEISVAEPKTVKSAKPQQLS